MTDGRGYEALRAALRRLQGTQIETNITTGGTEQLDIFSLIDRARIVRETRDGRMQEIEIELSDWVFNAIRAREVLTLHRNYFRLRKPLERRLYELARKHCGRQKQWRIGLACPAGKCGSASTLREFRRLVGGDRRARRRPRPYAGLRDPAGGDCVVFNNRGTMGRPTPGGRQAPPCPLRPTRPRARPRPAGTSTSWNRPGAAGWPTAASTLRAIRTRLSSASAPSGSRAAAGRKAAMITSEPLKTRFALGNYNR